MAKKGKEIDVGGFRLQVDPFIVLRRVLLRQKLLLALVAVIGGAATIVMYMRTPRIYRAYSTIALRTESLQEEYVRKLQNRAMRDVNSNSEMMLIINELDLFSATRATMPYEMALKSMRRELKVDSAQGSIGVGYESPRPVEAKQVVAFVTERVLGKFANLLDSPYRRQIEALQRGLDDIEPRVEKARTKLFEFKALHPDIAVSTPDFIREDSPLAAIQKEIERAEQNLKRCFGGERAPARPVRRDGPACVRLRELERRLVELKSDYTPNHPEVVSAQDATAKQEIACERESGDAAGGIKPGQTQGDCVDAAKGRIAALHRDRIDIEKKAIKKPRFQREWAELSLETSQLESQLRAMRERRAKLVEERLIAANEFGENFQLVDPPTVPELPIKPVRNQFMLTGMAITAILGLLLASLREAFRQSFMDPKEFEEQTGLQVLAVLPDISQT